MSKNYLVFKGINSNTFDNLVISELSPISSPEIRVDITEIDGADGDIVDEKGYRAYNKSIKIGLKNSNNIDKIIKYFSGSGDLVLSNEPDKVYKAQIYSKVDYERLLTFRTAKVTFHVQPFKYALNEPPFVFNITNETEVKVTNVGLEKSKPIITLYGDGEVTLTINGYDVFTVNIDDEFVVIDSMQLEAYKGLILKNRKMSGNFPILDVGVNTISWTGNLTKLIVEPKSRWL
jgi:predicted phage tail component-like protein